jgi:transcription initiation factor TFIID subunit 2
MLRQVWSRINKTLEAVEASSVRPPPIAVPLRPQPQPYPDTPTTDSLHTSASGVRPTIKLKVGASVNKVSDHAKTPKLQGRKPKPVDVPPPPYVDDGSHDLLQEVIAIEQEKNEEKIQRHKSHSDHSNKVSEGVSAKRRKLSPEDELIALASPIRDKSTSSGSSGVAAKETSSASFTKPLSNSHNGKKDKSRPTGVVHPATEPPRISVKGKEREVLSPAISSKPKKVAVTPINEKKCRDVLKVLLKLPEAMIFSRPVDAELDGCPT